jgi:protein phosphatase
MLKLGSSSRGAAGKANEDFTGVVRPDEPGIAARGVLIAIADGVSASGAGRIASETVVRTLLSDFYATPAHWNTALALDRVLRAANDWLAAENARRPSLEGVVAAVSALILLEGRYYVAHVGHTRVYRLRQGSLQRLTVDHTWARGDLRHVPKRALGLDTHLVVDYATGALEAGDVFVLVTDGVWDVLGDARLKAMLQMQAAPDEVAAELVEAARAHQAAYMGRNDASALVASIGGSLG